jgi:hypothetical protein
MKQSSFWLRECFSNIIKDNWNEITFEDLKEIEYALKDFYKLKWYDTHKDAINNIENNKSIMIL